MRRAAEYVDPVMTAVVVVVAIGISSGGGGRLEYRLENAPG